MDAAKALEKIKEALDSGMGPLPTLGMIRETVAEMFPPAPATAPPSDLKILAAQSHQGKSAAPYLKLKQDAVLKFMDSGPPNWLYDKYMMHSPQPAYNAVVGPDGKVTPVPANTTWQGHKPVGVIYDEMADLEEIPMKKLSDAMKQMSASLTAAKIKPEDIEVWKTLLGEKPESPND